MPENFACGIDFGTSNSTVALARGSEAALVTLEHGKTTLPSAVFFRKDGMPLFGRAAIDAYLAGAEGRLIRGLKKILGTSLMMDKTQLGGRSVNFTDILKVFIGELKKRAETDAAREVTSVVMGRPVHFHDNNHDADQLSQDTLEGIVRALGCCDIEFLYEPIAAAFAHEERVAGEKLALVIDLGGGTSDFTVIRMARHRMGAADRSGDILATSGVRVGGTTFDHRLSIDSFMPFLGLGSTYGDSFDADKVMHMPAGVYFQLSDWALVHQAQAQSAINQTRDLLRRAHEPEKMERLLRVQQDHLGYAVLEEVEKAKIVLTQAVDCRAALGVPGEENGLRVTRKKFEKAIRADIDRIFSALRECLARAGITGDEIELVILTGGSTALPLVNDMVERMFPHAEKSVGNRMDSVGLGLARHAQSIFGR